MKQLIAWFKEEWEELSLLERITLVTIVVLVSIVIVLCAIGIILTRMQNA